MAKPAWGKKRNCQSCGAVFYDMKKNPAACPKCGTEDNLQPLLKPRRTAPAAPKPKPSDTGPKGEADDIDDIEVEDVDDDEDDDVSEVKEHIDSGDEDK